MATTIAANNNSSNNVAWWDLVCWVADAVFLPCKPILPFLLPRGEPRRTVVIGTILCPKEAAAAQNQNRVKLCFQKAGSPPEPPFLILDLSLAASDMEGSCRITLQCGRAQSGDGPLLDTTTWGVCCNGRKFGYGRRRPLSDEDAWVLEALRAVSTGAGVLRSPTPAGGSSSAIMYLRGNFHRVVGGADSESYHLVDPTGCLGPDISFFFLRY